MNKNSNITKLIDKIVALEMTKGIQPSELADSIYEKEYSEISFKKYMDCCEAIVKFKDIDDNITSYITMKYVYNNEKYLMRIEEKVNNKQYTIAWNRENIMLELFDMLKSELARLKLNMPKLLNSLPCDKQYSVKKLFQLVS